MKQAIVRVSSEMLARALNLPGDVKIVDIRFEDNGFFINGCWQLKLQSDSFPESGGRPPRAHVDYSTKLHSCAGELWSKTTAKVVVE